MFSVCESCQIYVIICSPVPMKSSLRKQGFIFFFSMNMQNQYDGLGRVNSNKSLFSLYNAHCLTKVESKEPRVTHAIN